MKILNRLRHLFSKEVLTLPPDSGRAERGRFGEALAARHCERELGYRIIARNWRCKRDELDIICMDAGVLVFIEVRARAAHARVGGFHSVDSKKKKVLRRGCKAYINCLPKPPKHVRFDVVEVVLSADGTGEVRHYANVPLFSKHYTTDS